MQKQPTTKSQQLHSKVYMVCLNPFCPSQQQRCLDSRKLHKHPQQCCHHLFPADLIIRSDWKQLQNYPSDSLGQSVKEKYTKCSLNSYISSTIKQLKQKIQKSINQLEKRLNQLYPIIQLEQFYTSVYSLQKISQNLKMKSNPTYINQLINNNFMRPKYNALLFLNQNYDQIKNTVDSLYNQMNQQIQQIVSKHYTFQKVQSTKTVKQLRKIKYDLMKSRFITSSEIQFSNGQIEFPKLKNMSSFLPWIYGEKSFNSGIHQIKISSTRFPLVQNSGFTVLQEADSDTYPYSVYKSLFNRESRGFKLVKGDHIQTFISKSTVLTMRLQLDSPQRALIFDSQMKCTYECPLKPRTNYRLGVYGSGWAIILIQLS